MPLTAMDLQKTRERLKALLPTITRLREITGAASVSFGVLHHGHIVLQGADGYRDATRQIPADVDTAYLIGSTMKAMMASCCGILVDEGKLSWNHKLSQYLPLHTVADPIIGKRATIRDALSHTTGLAQLDLSWYGASGKNLVDPTDLLHVVAHLPIARDFREGWIYCNYMYVIMARIIEIASHPASWSAVLAQRILEPLGMARSKFSRDDFPDHNIAEPYYVKDDRTPGVLPLPDLSAVTLMGPAGCLWSTVPDMLNWAGEVLRSLEKGYKENQKLAVLKQMDTITAHQAELTSDGLFENTYGYGWARLSMPSQLYGFMSTNGVSGDELLGRDSTRRLMLYHGGQVTGYLTTLCIFPETQSAIIVLSNAQALGDASDWTARAIMQELFHLLPPLDLISMAEKTAEDAMGIYSRIMKEYEQHRIASSNPTPLDGMLGVYRNDGLKLHLDVRRTDREDKSGEFLLNGMATQRHYLEHFRESTFGFPPESREEQESRCMVDYVSYEQFLLTFVCDGNGRYERLHWIMQPGLDPIVFTKLSEGTTT